MTVCNRIRTKEGQETNRWESMSPGSRTVGSTLKPSHSIPFNEGCDSKIIFPHSGLNQD